MDSDFVVGINKSIDAAKGETGQTYPAYLRNTLVTEKLDELAGAISEGGGGGGGTPQVQADWNETDTESKAYIKNKPTILPSTDVPGTLIAGETTITFNDSSITSNSTIIPFVDPAFIGVFPTAMSLALGSVTLTFPVQSTNMPVKVRVT